MTPYLLAPSPVAFAHRGGAAQFPENTDVAFAGAASLGFRYIETDLQRTRDGEWVIFHDAAVDRTTDGTGLVAEYTVSELARLDAGYRFSRDDGRTYPFRAKGARILTLQETLDQFPDLRFNLELKPDDPSLARSLFELLDRNGVHSRVLVASAHDRVTEAFRRCAGGSIVTSGGFGNILGFWLRAHAFMPLGSRPAYDALQVPLSYRGLPVVTRRFLKRAQDLGIRVHVWTINDRSTMDRLVELGVDGIMTDEPSLLLEALAGAPRG